MNTEAGRTRVCPRHPSGRVNEETGLECSECEIEARPFAGAASISLVHDAREVLAALVRDANRPAGDVDRVAVSGKALSRVQAAIRLLEAAGFGRERA